MHASTYTLQEYSETLLYTEANATMCISVLFNSSQKKYTDSLTSKFDEFEKCVY